MRVLKCVAHFPQHTADKTISFPFFHSEIQLIMKLKRLQATLYTSWIKTATRMWAHFSFRRNLKQAFPVQSQEVGPKWNNTPVCSPRHLITVKSRFRCLSDLRGCNDEEKFSLMLSGDTAARKTLWSQALKATRVQLINAYGTGALGSAFTRTLKRTERPRFKLAQVATSFSDPSRKWSQINQQEGINTSESGFYGSTRFVIMWEMTHKTFKSQRARGRAVELMAPESEYSVLATILLRLQSRLSYFPSDGARCIPVADKSRRRVSFGFCLATFSPWFTRSCVLILKLKG